MTVRIEGLTEVELQKIKEALKKPLKHEKRIKIIVVEDDEVQTLDGGDHPPKAGG